MSETNPLATIDLHQGNAARFVAHKLGASGAIVLISNPDGTVGMLADGVNNARANEMLSIGIYMNLQQHYDNVRAGAAGAQAAEHLAELDAKNKGGDL